MHIQPSRSNPLQGRKPLYEQLLDAIANRRDVQQLVAGRAKQMAKMYLPAGYPCCKRLTWTAAALARPERL
jgi:hypothetical protein